MQKLYLGLVVNSDTQFADYQDTRYEVATMNLPNRSAYLDSRRDISGQRLPRYPLSTTFPSRRTIDGPTSTNGIDPGSFHNRL